MSVLAFNDQFSHLKVDFNTKRAIQSSMGQIKHLKVLTGKGQF